MLDLIAGPGNLRTLIVIDSHLYTDDHTQVKNTTPDAEGHDTMG